VSHASILLPLALLAAVSCRTMAADHSIARIERIASSTALGGQPAVEIALTSVQPFPVLGEIATMHVGTRSFTISRHPGGDLRTLVFTLTVQEFDALEDGAEVWVQYGDDAAGAPGRHRRFGRWSKQGVP
jgi:hypothetical protein